MDNRYQEYPTEGRERASSSGVGQMWRSLVKRARKKHLPHQDPPQSSIPSVSGIQERPSDPQIPNHTQIPSYPQGPDYPATARYQPQSPPELGPGRARSPPQGSQPLASSQLRASRRQSELDYPVTQEQDSMNMLAASPVNATGSGPPPPQKLGQQVRTMPPEVIPGTEIIIALMGVTGAGKSYFIREVTGNPEVKVSSDLYSCTTKVHSYSFEYAGAKITLVDTPGFNDTERSDAEVLQEIADWTSATYKKDQLLSGIIYLHPITHTRMEGSARRNLRLFQSLCGQNALENVFLTTTQWSNVNSAEGELREARLRNLDFWGALIDKGATLQRFDGTRNSGLTLIHRLMLNTRKPLDIQYQIVKQNMTLLETDAGKYVNEELIALEKKFKQGVESLENQLQEALMAKDGEMNKLLMEERARAQNNLEMAIAGQKSLKELHAAEVKKREAREREEEERRLDRAVIAVAARDIETTTHITGVLTSYKTRGRLIFDIDNHEEFESDTIEVTINYQLNFFSGIRVYTKTFRDVFDAGIGDIVLDGVHYRCKSSTPIRVGNQEFVIFRRG